jgi:hypothetical protein
VLSDDELERWGADWEALEAARAKESVLGRKDFRRWELRRDWQRLIRELDFDEVVEAGVVSTLRAPLNGLLVLTGRRLLYVCWRYMRRPQVVSIERRAITSITVQERFRYGTIHVSSADAALDFRLVPNDEAWNFMGHWLAGLDEGDSGGGGTLAIPVPDRPPAIQTVETTVTVTAAAQALITERGGTLYLWQKPFSDGFATDKLSTREPADVDFWTLSEQGVVVRVGADLPRPSEVEVSVTRWPRSRMKVMWEGEHWGRRGFDLGGGA